MLAFDSFLLSSLCGIFQKTQANNPNDLSFKQKIIFIQRINNYLVQQSVKSSPLFKSWDMLPVWDSVCILVWENETYFLLEIPGTWKIDSGWGFQGRAKGTCEIWGTEHRHSGSLEKNIL